MSETLENLLHGDAAVPAAGGARRRRQRRPPTRTRRPRPTGSRFWEQQARRLDWAKEWDQVLDWSNPPFAKWFVGGAAQRRVQLPGPARRGRPRRQGRHPLGGRAGRHPHASPTPTCTELVCQAANALTELGVGAGDRVAIYLPMIPEAAVAMLACARIGATHSVVFGGFSVDALSRPDPGRGAPSSSSPPTAATGAASRRALKPTVDEAVAQCPSVEHVLVVRRTGEDVAWTARRTCGGTRRSRQASAEHERAAVRRRAPAVHPLHVAARRRSRRASCTPPAAT